MAFEHSRRLADIVKNEGIIPALKYDVKITAERNPNLHAVCKEIKAANESGLDNMMKWVASDKKGYVGRVEEASRLFAFGFGMYIYGVMTYPLNKIK